MALLPDLRFSPYTRQYVGSANDEFNNLVEQKITDYDVAKAETDVLASQNDVLLDSVLPVEGDRNMALRLQDRYRKHIQDIADRGDYENSRSEISRLSRDFVNQIRPLQQNAQRYQQYIQDIDKRTDISQRTKEAAKRASLANYRGLDESNIVGTSFTGIVPSKDVDLTEFVNKIGNDWESTKTVKITESNGRVSTLKIDKITPKELETGLVQALQGSKEVQEYLQTQQMLGLGESALQEIQNAVTFGVNKYSKYQEDGSLSYTPQHILDGNITLDALRNANVTSNVPVGNPNSVNKLQGMAIDKVTGRVGLNKNNFLEVKDGLTYKYVDQDGNLVSVAEVEEEKAFNRIKMQNAGRAASAVQAPKSKYTPVLATAEEIDALNAQTELVFNQMVEDAKTVYEFNKKLAKSRNQELPELDFESTATREMILNAYNKAIKENKVIIENKKFSPPVENRFRANAIDQKIAQDLMGRKVHVKGLEKGLQGIIETKQGVDYNALTNKLFDEGWVVKKTVPNGIDEYNSYGDMPSVNIVLELENVKTRETKNLTIGAETSQSEGQALIPLQNVMKLYYSGTSGQVNNPHGKPMFEVKTAVDLLSNRLVGTVIPIDEDGNKGDGVSIDSFQSYYYGLLRAQDIELQRAGQGSILRPLFGDVKTSKFSDD